MNDLLDRAYQIITVGKVKDHHEDDGIHPNDLRIVREEWIKEYEDAQERKLELDLSHHR